MVHFIGVIFYGIFASGEKQPWADPDEEDEPAELKPSAVPGGGVVFGGVGGGGSTGAPMAGVGDKFHTYGTTTIAPTDLYPTKLELIQRPAEAVPACGSADSSVIGLHLNGSASESTGDRYNQHHS